MDYEKLYNEALKRAKGICNVPDQDDITIARMEYLFPELKESEDEKIRKWLLDTITQIPNDSIEWEVINKADILAWLEKQGESGTFNVPQTPIKDAVEVTSRMQYISDDMKPIAEFIMGYANWDLHKDKWNQPTLTVPLFRVLDALIQRGKPYGECNQNIEKQGEKTLTVDIKSMVKSYKQRVLEQSNNMESPLVNMCVESFKHGIENTLDELNLKNLEKQGKKPTWSEEDEKIITALIEGFRYHQLFNPTFGEVPNAEIISWIKSLKERLS